MPDLARLLPPVVELCRRAGDAILAIYEDDEDVEVTRKEDDSPLTRADLASHRLLTQTLRELTPDIPVISEESAAAPAEKRAAWSRFWLVDPLDGTKEFLSRNGEFTVNVALIDGGSPVLGVVHAPALDRTWWAAEGVGAFRSDDGREAMAIRAERATAGPPRVAVSRSHPSAAVEEYLAALGEHERVAKGSSLKLCLVAEGSADLYPRLGRTMEWDIAAGHAVVRAAGGRVADREGNELRYNKPGLDNPHFVAEGASAG